MIPSSAVQLLLSSSLPILEHPKSLLHAPRAPSSPWFLSRGKAHRAVQEAVSIGVIEAKHNWREERSCDNESPAPGQPGVPQAPCSRLLELQGGCSTLQGEL